MPSRGWCSEAALELPGASRTVAFQREEITTRVRLEIPSNSQREGSPGKNEEERL